MGNWRSFYVWEQAVEARERYVRAYYSTRVRRAPNIYRGRKRNNYMTMQEHRALRAAEFQCRDEDARLKRTRFKRNPR